MRYDDPNQQLFPLTQSAQAWQATLPKLDLVARPALEQLLSHARPDARGLVTVRMNEWLFTNVAIAADDALWEYLEEEQVL